MTGPPPRPTPRQAELVTARVGEPTHAVARFVLHKQHGPDGRWHGEQQLWIAISDTSIWLLHHTHGRKIGGVKRRFPEPACTLTGLTNAPSPTTWESSLGLPIRGSSPGSCTGRAVNGTV